MDIEHVILGRSWLYNLNVIIFGQSNSCSFTFQSKMIKLIRFPLRPNNGDKRRKRWKQNGPDIISSKKFEKEVNEESIVFALVAKEIVENSSNEPPKEVNAMLKEF